MTRLLLPPRRLGALLVMASLVLTGCGDGEDGAAVDPTAAPTSSSSSSTTATTSPTTVATTAPPTTADTGTSGTSGTSGASGVAFPPAVEPVEHGGTMWALVLAAADATDHPDLVAATAAAGEAGYRTGPTDCDDGAAEAHGHGGGSTPVYTVSVYFGSRELAEQAAAAFTANGVPGGVVTQVRTFCLD